MNDRIRALEKALLWVILEQCEMGGKCYAKLLIHGEEAFSAVGLSDGCSVKDVEAKLFSDD